MSHDTLDQADQTANPRPSGPDSPTVCPRWVPNAISVARIALVPVWGVCAELCRDAMVAEQLDAARTMRLWTVVILVTIGLSDVLDGYLARRFGLTSRTGATLDALADKLAQVGLLLFFTVRGAPAYPQTPVWFLALVLLRDVYMAAGWIILQRRLGRVHVVHRFHGKLSSVLLFVLLVALTAAAPDVWTYPLILLITAIIILSTAAYTRDGFAQLRNPTRPG